MLSLSSTFFPRPKPTSICQRMYSKLVCCGFNHRAHTNKAKRGKSEHSRGNAGCYHCAYLILSLLSIGERAGIMIKRYDFSDPQAGKDVCDRRTAALKAHMRHYINEGKIFYCLSLWASATKKNIARLQKVRLYHPPIKATRIVASGLAS